MCNLYSVTKGQAAVRELAHAMIDRTGNLPAIPGIYGATDNPRDWVAHIARLCGADRRQGGIRLQARNFIDSEPQRSLQSAQQRATGASAERRLADGASRCLSSLCCPGQRLYPAMHQLGPAVRPSDVAVEEVFEIGMLQ